MNHPYDLVSTSKPVMKVTGQIGYYKSSWKVWSQYQNLNLSNLAPEATNADFTGSAPGFSLGVAWTIPLKFAGMSLGVDMNYLWLNFKRFAGIITADQEVVASYNGTPMAGLSRFVRYPGPVGIEEALYMVDLHWHFG